MPANILLIVRGELAWNRLVRYEVFFDLAVNVKTGMETYWIVNRRC
jgi:hypothetical protein